MTPRPSFYRLSTTIILSITVAAIADAERCILDDVQKTPGQCMSIKQCPQAISRLYAGAPVKRCPTGKDAICCPTEVSLAQKKCAQWTAILKAAESFSQPPYAKPECAYKGAQSLIVGGRDAKEFEYPFAVGLGYGDNPNNLDFYCGATLISDQWLLTAAHCVSNNKKGRPKWGVIGDTTLKVSTSVYRKKVRIVDWVLHPNYTTPKIYDDIALLKLGEKLDLSRYVIPACLGDPQITPKGGGDVHAVGWGQLGFNEDQAAHLQAVNLKVFGSKDCNTHFNDAADKPFKYPQGFLKSQMCAGDRSAGDGLKKDTCNGDSGGGIVVNPEYPCLYHVVGVTSTGSKYCGYGEPAIYTKVATYIDWIERTIWT